MPANRFHGFDRRRRQQRGLDGLGLGGVRRGGISAPAATADPLSLRKSRRSMGAILYLEMWKSGNLAIW